MSIRLVVSLLLICSTTSWAGVDWRYLPQPFVDPDSKPLFVDLDGDGSSEIVFLGASPVIAVLGNEDDELRLLDLFSLPERAQGQLASLVAEDGATHLLAAIPSGLGTSIWEIGGRPLRLIRVVDVDLPIRMNEVIDLNGDGSPEILGSVAWGPEAGKIVALSFPAGGLLWTSEHHGGGGAATAIRRETSDIHDVLVPGNPFRVLDGTDGKERWSNPELVFGSVNVGRFQLDPDIATFAFSSGTTVRVYRADPYVQLSSFAVSGFPSIRAGVFDVTGDGVDELIVDNGLDYDIHAYNVSEGELIASVPAEWAMTTIPTLGRLASEESPVLVYGSRYFATPQLTDGVKVVDFPDATIRYESNSEVGPFWGGVFNEVGNGSPGMLVLSSSIHQQWSWTRNLVINEFDAFGHLQRRKEIPDLRWSDSFDERYAHIGLADVDGDGRDDIIYGMEGSTSGVFAVIDGQSLEVRWRLTPEFGSPLDDRFPVAVTAADFDQDGLPDAVFLNRYLNMYRLLVLSGIDGSVIYESGSLGVYNGSSAGSDMITVRFEKDGPLKVVLNTPTNAIIVDPVNPVPVLGHWTVVNMFSSVRSWGFGEDCRIGLVVNRDSLMVRRCDDLAYVEDRGLPYGTDFIQTLDSDGHRFLVAHGGRLSVVDADSQQDLMINFGGSLLRGVSGHATRSSVSFPGGVDVLLGSDTEAFRFVVRPDQVFSDGFESIDP